MNIVGVNEKRVQILCAMMIEMMISSELREVEEL